MLYSEYRTQALRTTCHFCDPHDRIFIENNDAFLTYAIAPYHEHHLLVIPRRHVKSFMELTEEEGASVWSLIRKASAVLLELGYKNYTVIVREGASDAKSVEHLHYHVIPEHRIGDLDYQGVDRAVLSPYEIQKISEDIREAIRQLAFTGL